MMGLHVLAPTAFPALSPPALPNAFLPPSLSMRHRPEQSALHAPVLSPVLVMGYLLAVPPPLPSPPLPPYYPI